MFSEPVYENVTDTMAIYRKEANCNGSLDDTTVYLTYEKRILKIPGRFGNEVIPAEYVTRNHDFNKDLGQKLYLFDGYKLRVAKGVNTIQVDFYNEEGLLQKSLKIKECEEEMRRAAKELCFEAAAQWRDQMRQYQQIELTLA